MAALPLITPNQSVPASFFLPQILFGCFVLIVSLTVLSIFYPKASDIGLLYGIVAVSATG